MAVDGALKNTLEDEAAYCVREDIAALREQCRAALPVDREHELAANAGLRAAAEVRGVGGDKRAAPALGLPQRT